MQQEPTRPHRRYGTKRGSGFDEEMAQRIGAELERIARGKPFDSVSPEEVVEAAEQGKAPECARRMTWDNDAAAHRWRIHEAQTGILTKITIIESDARGEDAHVQAFHPIKIVMADEDHKTRKERRFVPLEVVREEQEIADLVVDEAQRELIRARKKLAFHEQHVRTHRPALARVMDTVKAELEADPSSKVGYVYVLHAPAVGAYKIGRSANPKRRATVLEIQLPFPVRMLATIRTEDSWRLEKILHQKFDAQRLNGEWFDLSEEDVAYITELAA